MATVPASLARSPWSQWHETAAIKGNHFWMLLACFLSFFLSPYLTCLWCFCMLVWRCSWMRRKCMRSTGCGSSPSSKHSSSRNSNRNSSFLSNLGSRLSSLSVFPMPSFASFTAWRSQRTSDTTNGGDVESPQVDASPGDSDSLSQLYKSPHCCSSRSCGQDHVSG